MSQNVEWLSSKTYLGDFASHIVIFVFKQIWHDPQMLKYCE